MFSILQLQTDAAAANLMIMKYEYSPNSNTPGNSVAARTAPTHTGTDSTEVLTVSCGICVLAADLLCLAKNAWTLKYILSIY